MESKLKEFYKYNEGTYYLISDVAGYTTILRVDDVGFEGINTLEFIQQHIGEVESFNYDTKDIKFDFTIRGKRYYLFNYDQCVVSI